MTMEKMLSQSIYQDRLMIESEVANDVTYEVKGRACCVFTTQSGRVNRIYGSLKEMKSLACEMIKIIECWDGIAT